jgi:RHS repeat-associated protein
MNLANSPLVSQITYQHSGTTRMTTTTAYDDLNRLTLISSQPSGSGVPPVSFNIHFVYDAKGRRIQKTVTNGIAIVTTNFVYDGWNLIGILAPNSSLRASFLSGNDLSGSPQGAGGVGGLLELSCFGSSQTNSFVAYDGNGNVASLINAASGIAVANYEYGPFGEVIRQTGPMAKVNPMRFSTKYQDDESDLLYYGYRYYKPSTGAWLSRDSINEVGFELTANRPKNRTQSADMESVLTLIDKLRTIKPLLAIGLQNLLGRQNVRFHSEKGLYFSGQGINLFSTYKPAWHYALL